MSYRKKKSRSPKMRSGLRKSGLLEKNRLPAHILPTKVVKSVTYITTCPVNQLVLSFLRSQLNTALNYNPAGRQRRPSLFDLQEYGSDFAVSSSFDSWVILALEVLLVTVLH